MASNNGARCCTIGVKHEGEAKGELKNIGKSESSQQGKGGSGIRWLIACP